MNRIATVIGTTALVLFTSAALATGPNPNSVVFVNYIFDNCPTSTLVENDNYPASVLISDSVLDCGGFANLHAWRFSDDGASQILFDNNSAFRFSFDMVVSGTSEGEAGAQVAPWWSDADGRFNCRTTDGEIAVFGGRLPFYSFTVNHSVNYVKGTSIRLQVTYFANDLTPGNPATIEYELTYNAVTYSSGALAFDEGNPAEDPPHGLWGMLNEAKCGGYMAAFLQGGNPAANLQTEFTNIVFEQLKPVSVEQDSWGSVKASHR